ncbi:MAG: DMT family transporter [Bacteroidota bacterium]|nr:DMT family transporter [Bacteroidota bacterium]
MAHSGNYKGVIYAAIAGLMWGILSVALKITLNVYALSSFTIVWFRFSIAFIILAIVLFIKRPALFRVFYKPPLKLIGATLCLGFNYYAYMKGLEYTTPGNAQIFTQVGPVLFAMAGIYIFKEKITWKHILGFLIVLFGLGLFYWEQLFAMANQKIYSFGILWILASAVTWAFYAIWQKELSQQYSTNQLNLFIYGLCSIVFVPGVHLSGFHSLDFPGWLLVIFLGLNTLIAYGAIALAFRHLDSSKVSVIVTVNPIVTFAIMYLFAEMNVTIIAPEHFSLASILGAMLALAGAIFVILFTRKD